MRNAPFKFGIVSDLDASKGRAKVTLPDENGISTAFLPIIQEETVNNPSSKTISIGSHVLVALDEKGNTGAIIGPYYPDGETPPAGEEVWMRQMSDGGFIAYDPEAGSYHVKATSKIFLEVGGHHITIDGGGIRLKGNVSIEGNLNVSGATDLKATKINGIPQSGS